MNVPWIEGSELSETNLEQSERTLNNVCRKLSRDKDLAEGYEKIVREQLGSGTIERASEEPTGKRIFYLPHKPVVRNNASTTKIRMLFDASAKPQPLASSINECMHTGPPLQPHLWDIMIRTRMAKSILLADIQKAFHQIGIKQEDRDAFRFLFNINGQQGKFGLKESLQKPVHLFLAQPYSITIINNHQNINQLFKH